MRPVISIVGRPNVGKSMLYNRLTRSRDALVDDRPGVTRDRQVGLGRIGSQSFWAIDTGGLEAGPDALQSLLSQQVEAALADSDAVILLVDGRDGPCAADFDIAAALRRRGRLVQLAVNKCEGLSPDVAVADFHQLGLDREPLAISAKNGDGVRGLLERLLAATSAGGAARAADPQAPHVGVVGRPNVGKSTLVNRLLGEQRMVVYNEPGTTRDSVRVPFRCDGVDYVLVDTAGVRRRSRVTDRLERYSIARTLQTLEQVQVVVLVLDAQDGVSEQDARLAGLVQDSGRAMVLAINKWDGLEPSQRSRVRRELDRRLPFLDEVQRLFISARFGSGLGALMPAVARAYDSTMAHLGTGRLNAALRQALAARPPPVVGGRRIKLKYAHQGGKNPPQIIVHGNLVDKVPAAYRRYLARRFSRAFSLVGVRVQVLFKAGDNPYTGGARGRPRGRRQA